MNPPSIGIRALHQAFENYPERQENVLLLAMNLRFI